MNIKLDDFFKTKLNEVSIEYRPECWDEMQKKLDNTGGGTISGSGSSGAFSLFNKIAVFVGTILVVGLVYYYGNTSDDSLSSDTKDSNIVTSTGNKTDNDSYVKTDNNTGESTIAKISEEKSEAKLQIAAPENENKQENTPAVAKRYTKQTPAFDNTNNVSSEETEKTVSSANQYTDQYLDESAGKADKQNIVIRTSDLASKYSGLEIEKYMISPTVEDKIRDKFELEFLTSMLRHLKTSDLGILKYSTDTALIRENERIYQNEKEAVRKAKDIEKPDKPKDYKPIEKPVKHVFNKKKGFWYRLGFGRNK